MEERVAVEEIRREQILEAAFDVAAAAGLGGLTVRSVAARARVSHALVLFYFERKDRLLMALLEWLIARAAALRVEDADDHASALDRLYALLRQEMSRVAHEPEQTRLFFEYWALGARQPEIRSRISVELERYRAAFRTIVMELLDAERATFAGTTPAGLAALAVSWVQGGAVQLLADPEHFDSEAYLAAVRGIVGLLATPGQGR